MSFPACAGGVPTPGPSGLLHAGVQQLCGVWGASAQSRQLASLGGGGGRNAPPEAAAGGRGPAGRGPP